MDNVVVSALQGAPLIVILLAVAVVALWREVLKAHERVIQANAKAAEVMRPVIEQNLRTIEALGVLTKAVRRALARLRADDADDDEGKEL